MSLETKISSMKGKEDFPELKNFFRQTLFMSFDYNWGYRSVAVVKPCGHIEYVNLAKLIHHSFLVIHDLSLDRDLQKAKYILKKLQLMNNNADAIYDERTRDICISRLWIGKFYHETCTAPNVNESLTLMKDQLSPATNRAPLKKYLPIHSS